MQTKIGNNLPLIKGANREIGIDDIIIDKDYNAENASGFYLIKDIEIAKYYARKLTKLYGGKPTINLYNFDLTNAKELIKEAYFNEINEESMLYIGQNLKEILPEDCPRQGEGLPRQLCHHCNIPRCKRNADYIESILSEGGYYNLDNILIELVDKKITNEEAILKINKTLKEAGVDEIKIQISLREKAIKAGLTFKDSYNISLEGDD